MDICNSQEEKYPENIQQRQNILEQKNILMLILLPRPQMMILSNGIVLMKFVRNLE